MRKSVGLSALVALTLIVTAAAPMFAQSDSTRLRMRDSVRTFDPMIVTATRRSEHRSDAVVSTAVVSREDIKDAAASDVAAVLTQQLGLQLASGSPAGSQVLIQGLGDQRVLVMLDGQPLAGRIGGSFDLSRLPASIVERIEVVKGPQSVLYGTDAMGGVINIITRVPGAGLEGRALSGEASVIGGSHSRLDIATRIGGQLTAAVPFGVDVSRNHIGLAPGISGDAGAYADRWSISPRAQWKVSPTFNIDAGGLGTLEDQRYRTGQLFTFADNTQVAAHVAGTWTNGTSRLTPTISYSGFDHLSRSALGSRPASDSGARDIQRLFIGTLNYSGVMRRFLIDGGTELRHESIAADRVPSDRSTDAAAVFAQATWAADRIAIIPGARASWSEQWGASITPRLAAMLRPLGADRPLSVRASISGGFRSPDFKELYLQFVNTAAGYAVNGNPALRPEHSVNATLDVEWVGRKSDLRAGAFQNRIRDMIETVGPDGTGAYSYDNVGLARTSGIELEANQQFGSASVGLGYSYLHTSDLSAGGPLLGRPAHSGRASLRLETWKQVHVALTGLFTGEAPSVRDDAGNISETRKSLTQLNARIARSFTIGGRSAAEVFVGADNLFDSQQGTEWPGFTGRQFSVGLSWNSK